MAIKCINKKKLSKSQTMPEKEIEILKVQFESILELGIASIISEIL